MTCLALILAFQSEPAVRSPAIYRCPAKEAESGRLANALEQPYNSLCIDPSPGPRARVAAADAKVRFFSSKLIDTMANRRWRDASIDFVNSKISPAQWLARIRSLGATVHFLSSPSTPDLRTATPALEMDGTYSARSVFAELLLVSWPGRLCLTTFDTWESRDLPGAGKLQSWILAMHDNLGPMLSLRHDDPFLVTGTPKIIRADAKPGLLIFRQASGRHVMTFFLNNSPLPMELPKIDTDNVTLSHGLDLDGPKPMIQPTGVIIEDVGGD